MLGTSGCGSCRYLSGVESSRVGLSGRLEDAAGKEVGQQHTGYREAVRYDYCRKVARKVEEACITGYLQHRTTIDTHTHTPAHTHTHTHTHRKRYSKGPCRAHQIIQCVPRDAVAAVYQVAARHPVLTPACLPPSLPLARCRTRRRRWPRSRGSPRTTLAALCPTAPAAATPVRNATAAPAAAPAVAAAPRQAACLTSESCESCSLLTDWLLLC